MNSFHPNKPTFVIKNKEQDLKAFGDSISPKTKLKTADSL